MMKHLSQNKLNLLAQYQLSGDELLAALEHVEKCEKCSGKVRSPKASEILMRLQPDDPIGNTISFADQDEAAEGGLGWNWGWALGFASFALILLSIIGVYWLGSSQRPDQIAKVEPSPVPVASPSPAIAANSNPANSNTGVNDPPPGNSGDPGVFADAKDRYVPDNKLESSPIDPAAPGASREIGSRRASNLPAPGLIARAKKFAPKTQPAIPGRENGLSRFLFQTPASILRLRPFGSPGRSDSNTEEKGRFLSPDGEVIRGTKPEYRWSRIKEASDYEVSVADQRYEEIDKKTTPENSYKSDKDLARGKTYLWKVTANTPEGKELIPGGEGKSGIFKVADEKTIRKLEKLEKKPNSEWKIVKLAIKEGMLAEAEKVLERLSSRAPSDQFAKKLLRRVKNLRNPDPMPVSNPPSE